MGKWVVGVTDTGSLGFYKGTVLEMFIEEGQMWGKAEGVSMTPTCQQYI